jgi:hypothetical protein
MKCFLDAAGWLLSYPLEWFLRAWLWFLQKMEPDE